MTRCCIFLCSLSWQLLRIPIETKYRTASWLMPLSEMKGASRIEKVCDIYVASWRSQGLWRRWSRWSLPENVGKLVWVVIKLHRPELDAWWLCGRRIDGIDGLIVMSTKNLQQSWAHTQQATGVTFFKWWWWRVGWSENTPEIRVWANSTLPPRTEEQRPMTVPGFTIAGWNSVVWLGALTWLDSLLPQSFDYAE